MSAYINHHEWRTVGLSRSGNHAVINWLLAQTTGSFCFLNCVEPKSNPFESPRPMGSGALYVSSDNAFDLHAERCGRFSEKHYLLYSYEDCFLGLLRHPASEARRDEWVGRSWQRRDLLIIRDPFNLFASRMHFGLTHMPHHRAMRIWKQHAREALAIRRYLAPSRIIISYNQWVTSADYRKGIAEQLGLRFTDAAFDQVAETAGGSSFDGLKHDGRASQMRVLDRWLEFADEPRYWGLFDEEVFDLSRRLFGQPPTPPRGMSLRTRAGLGPRLAPGGLSAQSQREPLPQSASRAAG